MTATSHAVGALGARLDTLGLWARRGPIRALVTRLVLTVVGTTLLLAGVAMIVLPGPGLVVITAGFGVLAAEWDWARRLVQAVGAPATRLRHAVLPEGCSPRRKAAAGILVGGFMVLGFLATTAVTAFLGATTIF